MRKQMEQQMEQMREETRRAQAGRPQATRPAAPQQVVAQPVLQPQQQQQQQQQRPQPQHQPQPGQQQQPGSHPRPMRPQAPQQPQPPPQPPLGSLAAQPGAQRPPPPPPGAPPGVGISAPAPVKCGAGDADDPLSASRPSPPSRISGAHCGRLSPPMVARWLHWAIPPSAVGHQKAFTVRWLWFAPVRPHYLPTIQATPPCRPHAVIPKSRYAHC